MPFASSSKRQISVPAQPKAWVDPSALPDDVDVDVGLIRGSAPDHVKQLVCNTFYSYGVGEPDVFGYGLGRATRFVQISVDPSVERGGRMEAVTVAEVTITKSMLNGAGMLHGGCVTYLIDNCASTPLVALGLMSGTNGVGVTQGMNVLFHAPAPIGTTLRISSSSISMGGRVMAARCEITDKTSGRVVASAFLNKMQPNTRL
ncbi:4HBT domain-containing protein [Mycena indigotica]|uniref:4HBT domain-containing protein n=1 Tax=Mycena indigotica TaxID=2126181 RepID=A0A8H6RZW9_9AGAR|nr:4HBT domain-containing protein [Mycena indigotica]KAF7289912.1 4HBT domain-containing protein [Mycena indigotica]